MDTGQGRTTTMRHYARPPHLVQPLRLDQPQHRMERASHFERADALEILALEEQPHFGRGRLLPLPWRALQCSGRLGRRCQLGQRRVGQHGRGVDVGFDECVGFFDGGACQGAMVAAGGWSRGLSWG